MPGIDGFALCRTLRAEGDRVPIVLLTSRDSDIDEALGLDLGADDYVTKPLRVRVLLARVAAILRREAVHAGAPEDAAAPTLVRGALELDPERIACRWRGVPIALTVSEFRLLETLARRPGVVLSRERLLSAVRDDDSVVVDRIIDTWVRRVRKKLEASDPAFTALETVVGAGYRWRDGDHG
jgi:DNA-binding response OmpR family regulator